MLLPTSLTLFLSELRTARRSPRAWVLAALALLAVGALSLAFLGVQLAVERAERVDWTNAHSAWPGSVPPDVVRIVGRAAIHPGRDLELDVAMRVRAPADVVDEDLVFSLNPGLRIESLLVDGEAAAHAHELGLLRVRVGKLAKDEEKLISMNARGMPDARFAYLDSATVPMDESVLGSPLAILGEQAALFEDEYIALMPGICWLPCAGAHFFGRVGRPDFRHIDLTVRLPNGWRAAGAGRSEVEGGFRFRPDVALAQFGIVAAPFERRALTVGRVQIELLFHPRHVRNIDGLGDANGALQTQLTRAAAGILQQPGLEYPFRVLTFAEAPAALRRFAGGGRLTTVQAIPGVQLLPEHGFPASQVATKAGRFGYDALDLAGPNGIDHSVGVERNLLSFITRPRHNGAQSAPGAAVNALLESLTAHAIMSSHTALSDSPTSTSEWRRLVDRLLASTPLGRQYTDGGPLHVWNAGRDASQHIPFARMGVPAAGIPADALADRANEIALATQALLGHRGTVALLAHIRRDFAGGTFTADDLAETVRDVSPALGTIFQHWLRESARPGFVAPPATVHRIADDRRGRPRYQILIHVHNTQPVPGAIQLRWRTTPRSLSFSPAARRWCGASAPRNLVPSPAPRLWKCVLCRTCP